MLYEIDAIWCYIYIYMCVCVCAYVCVYLFTDLFMYLFIYLFRYLFMMSSCFIPWQSSAPPMLNASGCQDAGRQRRRSRGSNSWLVSGVNLTGGAWFNPICEAWCWNIDLQNWMILFGYMLGFIFHTWSIWEWFHGWSQNLDETWWNMMKLCIERMFRCFASHWYSFGYLLTFYLVNLVVQAIRTSQVRCDKAVEAQCHELLGNWPPGIN